MPCKLQRPFAEAIDCLLPLGSKIESYFQMVETEALEIRIGDALLVVDVQNDFLPGGSLPVHEGDTVIPPLNRAIEEFERQGLPIFASRDWHPSTHCSFREWGGPWPVHCVAETEGAQFPKSLKLPSKAQVISKAMNRNIEAYSCFSGTDLFQRLRALGVHRVFIGGLTLEYCVFNSVKDAVEEGLEVVVFDDAVRAISDDPKEVSGLKKQMHLLGARLIRTDELRSLAERQAIHA